MRTLRALRAMRTLRALAALAVLAPGAALADSPAIATGQSHAHARRDSKPVPHGVLVPDRRVDPGMKVIAPRMPPQSTPVLRPPPTAPGGTTVVPK